MFRFFSTTGIHESAIEKGYSIWINHVYILFFNLISQLTRKFYLKDFFAEDIETHIHAHGGNIRFKEINDGAEFIIELPFS